MSNQTVKFDEYFSFLFIPFVSFPTERLKT